MKDCASRAQHYHDLALEFLVLTRLKTAADIKETYRMMGRHYLARARTELARAKRRAPATSLEMASGSALAQSS
jgi:hypothetical protein